MRSKDFQGTYFGLSTDDKPSGNKVNNGSAFIEMDTSKIYFYNAEDDEWLEFNPTGSSGGDEDDQPEGEDNMFKINCSIGANDALTLDKTFNEIREASFAGKLPIIFYNNTILYSGANLMEMFVVSGIGLFSSVYGIWVDGKHIGTDDCSFGCEDPDDYPSTDFYIPD